MPALGSGDALDRQGRCLGLGGNLFQNQGAPFAGIEQVQIDEGSARQPIFGGETGVGIFRRQVALDGPEPDAESSEAAGTAAVDTKEP